MRVAFRVDATPLIGGGHAMRCLTLADELRRRGAETLFVSAAMTESIARKIAERGHDLRTISGLGDDGRAGSDWHQPPASAHAQRADAQATLQSLGGPCGWMAVDHYLLDAHWHSSARAQAERILVIDDLANRQYDCDLLLDQNFGRAPGDYDGQVPASTERLMGPAYALLRPEFARERGAALLRRREPSPVRRILLSLGATDIGGLTAQALATAFEVAGDCQIDVVIAPSAPSAAEVSALAERHPRIAVRSDAANMAELMRDADLAIGAAGGTSWERCCLGLPTIVLVVAGNQRAAAAALEQTGAVIAADCVGDIAGRLQHVLGDSAYRQQMSAAAFAIVDGAGCERVADRLTGSAQPVPGKLTLRPATRADAERLWLWRNEPSTRANSRSTAAIPWQEHERWIEAVLADPHRRLLIAETPGGPAGMVRFDALAGQAGAFEVSIALAPLFRGGGLATTMLSAAVDELFSTQCARAIHASVAAGNAASRRLFERCGFAALPDRRGGLLHYVREQRSIAAAGGAQR